MPEGFWESLWNPESYAKVLILMFTYPLWSPVLKVMWQELQDALAPEGGLYGRREKRDVARRAPGLDPWVNVPLARQRRMGAGAPPRAQAAPGSQTGGGRPGPAGGRAPVAAGRGGTRVAGSLRGGDARSRSF